MSITSNIDGIVRAWEARAKKIVSEMRKATRQATMMVYAASRDELKKGIYDKPEDTLAQVAKDRGIGAVRRVRKKVRRRVGYIDTYEGTTKYEDVEEVRDVMESVPGRFIRVGKKGKKRTIVIPLRDKDKRKKAWRRTGNLRRSERFRIVSAYEGIIYNDAVYAYWRHNLKRTKRKAPWRLNAVRRVRKQVKAIYRNAIITSIRAGKIPGPK